MTPLAPLTGAQQTALYGELDDMGFSVADNERSINELSCKLR